MYSIDYFAGITGMRFNTRLFEDCPEWLLYRYFEIIKLERSIVSARMDALP